MGVVCLGYIDATSTFSICNPPGECSWARLLEFEICGVSSREMYEILDESAS